jgi:hypothetical protein
LVLDSTVMICVRVYWVAVIHLQSVVSIYSDLIAATHLVLDLVEVISMYVCLHLVAVIHSQSGVMIHSESDLVVAMH